MGEVRRFRETTNERWLEVCFNLKARFDEDPQLHLRKGKWRVSEGEIIGVVIKLIFMKIVDEKSPRKEMWFWISEREYEEMSEVINGRRGRIK